MVLSFSVFPRKLTREALFMVLLRIWLPQMMKRLLRKPRRQKGIRGRKTAFDNVWPLSVASCDKFCISIDCIHWPNSFLQVKVARSQFEKKITFSLYLVNFVIWHHLNYLPKQPSRELWQRDTQQEVEENRSSKPDNVISFDLWNSQ